MDHVSIRDLRTLVETGVAPCVTIHLPTQLVGRDRLGDEVRLKNLTQQAEDELSAHWMRAPEARKMMQAARELAHDVGIWSQRGRGFAVFVDPNSCHHFCLPEAPQEFLHVGKRFRIKALLPLVDRGERCLILTLSQNNTRLLEADRHGTKEVAVKDLPQRRDQALQLDGADRGEQVHSGGSFNPGKQAAVFHGQGGQPDARKDEIKLYFREVNKALAPLLRQEGIPLILVGVDYLLPIFREICDYSGLATEQVAGNFDYNKAGEIHRQVWPVIEKMFDAPRQSAAARLRQLLGTPKMSDNPTDVLLAASEGRVATLFVNAHLPQWGVFDEEKKHVTRHHEFEPGDEDLLELATVETLRCGGDVYSTDDLELPSGDAIAAVYRY